MKETLQYTKEFEQHTWKAKKIYIRHSHPEGDMNVDKANNEKERE